ncbi:MAG: hypothetical protein AWT59_2856 [Candidatus Gallionella acididurans]|uniref:Uncharacterized protein n=1 Tax=Candidatus Gallionella acididurans TaxID=1796491 RepID=A0A139BPT7_9PROT|nr:MAG: hypothetical protein AWT59_2856 [Candidatus Gallionella acididurans]
MAIARFVLYGLSFASSLLIVAFVPKSLSGEFLSTYAASSLIGGIGIVLAFSSPLATSTVRYWATLALVCICLVGLIWPQPGVWILYAGALLMSDYMASQSGSNRLPIIYRVIMIISALPFIFFSTVFTSLILVRTALCFVVIAAVLVKTKNLKVLKIHKSFWYVSVSHLAYFGTLLSITVMLPNDLVRAWYIGTQVGFGLLLKRFDFLIRDDAVSHSYIDYGIPIFATAIPCFIMVFWYSAPALLAYITGVFAISRLKFFLQ